MSGGQRLGGRLPAVHREHHMVGAVGAQHDAHPGHQIRAQDGLDLGLLVQGLVQVGAAPIRDLPVLRGPGRARPQQHPAGSQSLQQTSAGGRYP